MSDIDAAIEETIKDAASVLKFDEMLEKAKGLGIIAMTEYPAIDWTVTNLLPTGFAIFSGGSKLGKTWICLQMASAVSLGMDFLGNQEYPCKKGEVLLLALQISDRMLHNRMEVAGILGDDRVSVLHTFPRGDDALKAVQRWKDLHPQTRLVIIDMLEQVRDRDPEHENTYSVNVLEISKWAKLADDLKISIIGTTHDRKTVSEDFVSDIMGSVGSVGSAAVLWSLKRRRGSPQATLFASGWEITDQELPLEYEQSTGWRLCRGTVQQQRTTVEQQQILDLLLKEDQPMSPREISDTLNQNASTIRSRLRELKIANYVQNCGKGLYIYNHNNTTTTTTTTTDNSESARVRASVLPVVPVVDLFSGNGKQHKLSTKVDNLTAQSSGEQDAFPEGDA